MKKAITVLLVLLLVAGLTACESKEAKAIKEVEKTIEAINIDELTLESESVVVAAENAFVQLPEESQKKIGNYSHLEEARKKVDSLTEIHKLLGGFNDLISGLEFTSKYAGNVNGRGEMAFAQSMIDKIKLSIANIDFDKVGYLVPDSTKYLKQIQSGNETIASALVQMGRTNSSALADQIRKTAKTHVTLCNTVLALFKGYK